MNRKKETYKRSDKGKPEENKKDMNW